MCRLRTVLRAAGRCLVGAALASAAVAAPVHDVPGTGPLDAALSGYAYPFPVERYVVDAQGQRLEMAYMDIGAGDAGTVVLMHGKNFSGAYWARTARDLVARGYRVVMPDQIGFGKSSKPTSFQYTFDALAFHTDSLLQALDVDSAIVVGHSMGGMLAARFALAYTARIDALVLVNPIGLEDWRRHVPYQPVSAWVEAERRKTPASIRAYMQRNYFDGRWRDAFDELVAIQAGWVTGPDRDRLAFVSALTYDMIFTQPVVTEFDRIAAPTLLVIGTRDRTALGRQRVAPDVARGLGRYDELGKKAAAVIPDATLVELDDVGHVPFFEAYDAWFDALAAFLTARAAQP